MDRFDAMQAFARVVEAGSFTRAAETLQLSKTTVTQLVQQLEARLRVRLLHRTTRRLRLTADGAVYYERVLRLLADLEEAEGSLAAASAAPRGRLRVDVPTPLARMVLLPALPSFLARYPEIRLDLGVSDRMVDLIGDDVDCVVRGGELDDPSLVARRVAELQFGVYAAPDYLARAGRPEHPLALQRAPYCIVGYRSSRTGRLLSWHLHHGDERIVVQGDPVLTVDDGNAYLAAGLAGLGLLCMPTYMADPHLERGELLPLFEQWHFDPMPLYVAYRPNPHLSARLRVFIDWVAELMARHAPPRGAQPPG